MFHRFQIAFFIRVFWIFHFERFALSSPFLFEAHSLHLSYCELIGLPHSKQFPKGFQHCGLFAFAFDIFLPLEHVPKDAGYTFAVFRVILPAPFSGKAFRLFHVLTALNMIVYWFCDCLFRFLILRRIQCPCYELKYGQGKEHCEICIPIDSIYMEYVFHCGEYCNWNRYASNEYCNQILAPFPFVYFPLTYYHFAFPSQH
jgi:hypothetical protein